MEGEEQTYAIILLGILAYMLVLYLQDSTNQSDSALVAKKHFSTACAFWFYFVAFSFLLIFWLLVREEHLIEKNGLDTGLTHAAAHLPRVMSNWFANLSLLMAAIAYSSGKDFDIRTSIWRAGMASVIMLLWVMLWELVGHANNLFWTALLIAPELAIATVAMVALGWAFYVRWSGLSFLYFILAMVYALLQLPAYLELELDAFFTPEKLATLRFAFPLLAACQIMLAYGFLSLLCRSTVAEIKIDEPRHWPSGTRTLSDLTVPHVGGVWLGKAVDLGFGALVAIVMWPLGEKFGPLLWRLL